MVLYRLHGNANEPAIQTQSQTHPKDMGEYANVELDDAARPRKDAGAQDGAVIVAELQKEMSADEEESCNVRGASPRGSLQSVDRRRVRNLRVPSGSPEMIRRIVTVVKMSTVPAQG